MLFGTGRWSWSSLELHGVAAAGELRLDRLDDLGDVGTHQVGLGEAVLQPERIAIQHAQVPALAGDLLGGVTMDEHGVATATADTPAVLEDRLDRGVAGLAVGVGGVLGIDEGQNGLLVLRSDVRAVSAGIGQLLLRSQALQLITNHVLLLDDTGIGLLGLELDRNPDQVPSFTDAVLGIIVLVDVDVAALGEPLAVLGAQDSAVALDFLTEVEHGREGPGVLADSGCCGGGGLVDFLLLGFHCVGLLIGWS
jgi:hypothetical protein